MQLSNENNLSLLKISILIKSLEWAAYFLRDLLNIKFKIPITVIEDFIELNKNVIKFTNENN